MSMKWQGTESPDDRRCALRQPTVQITIFVDHAGYGTHRVDLVDISRSGARFQTATYLPCGGEILMHPPVDAPLLSSRARIIRERIILTAQGERYEYGVQFTDGAELRRHTWFLALREAA